MLNMSKDTYNNIDLISQGFGDCSAESVIKNTTLKTHVPKYERCQRRVMDQSADCEVLHDYDASVVKLLSTMTDRTTSKVVGLIARNYGLVR